MTQETVNEMVLKALKSGINFIDTAPWYGQGVSEERLGVALENVPREKYFIATKVTSTSFSAFKDFPKLSFLSLQVGRYQIEPLNEMFDFSVDKVERSVKDSLQKLGLSYVDLIQVPKNISQFSIVNYHFSFFFRCMTLNFPLPLSRLFATPYPH